MILRVERVFGLAVTLAVVACVGFAAAYPWVFNRDVRERLEFSGRYYTGNVQLKDRELDSILVEESELFGQLHWRNYVPNARVRAGIIGGGGFPLYGPGWWCDADFNHRTRELNALAEQRVEQLRERSVEFFRTRTRADRTALRRALEETYGNWDHRHRSAGPCKPGFVWPDTVIAE